MVENERLKKLLKADREKLHITQTKRRNNWRNHRLLKQGYESIKQGNQIFKMHEEKNSKSIDNTLQEGWGNKGICK